MTTYAPTAQSSRRLAPIAAGSAITAIALLTYGAHNWTEVIVSTSIVVAVTALVFGLVVPRALRKGGGGATGLALSVPALLLVVPAFWSGLPLVLGVAGMLVGDAGRHAGTGSGKAIAALVLGALAIVAYAAIYIADAFLGGGGAGFLLD